jgi:xanthine/uracil permease
MELEVTWGRAVRVWWSYLWRNLLAILAAMILGGIFGFIVGFIFSLLGFSREVTNLIVMPVGLVLGLAISIIPIKMILGKSFGEFKLVLVKNAG